MSADAPPLAPLYRLRGIDGRDLVFDLPAGESTVGSARDNDVRLPGAGVSRHHAVIRAGAEGLVIEDLGSKNGTTLDGRRVLRAAAGAGARIGFGPVELTVEGLADGAGLAIRFEAQPDAGGSLAELERAETPLIRADDGGGESALATIEGGAATGVEPREGYFARAHGGTLFLDEIGELTPALQAKLLRTLQENEIQPVGGWPGNVRELEHAMRRVVRSRPPGGIVDEDGLPEEIRSEARSLADVMPEPETDDLELRPRVEALERVLIREAMRRAGGRQVKAAELLGVSRSGLAKMLERLDLKDAWARPDVEKVGSL